MTMEKTENTMNGCLSGVRVLDMTRVLAGPWSTQILADLGAEVIKIERPGKGDETRSAGPPFMRDRDGNEMTDAAYYLSTNRGKKSVSVNIGVAEGQDIIRKLAETSDVLIENFLVGTLEKYGLGYEDLRKINPRLIFCSITGYGQTGPYSKRGGYDFVFQALGGMMSITGEKGGTPQKVGVAVSDLMTGLYSTIAIQAALAHRAKTGLGQHIDMALLDVQVATLANMNMNYLYSGNTPQRMGNAHANLVPYQAFECRDGYVVVAAGNDNLFGRLCRALDLPDLADDPLFATNPMRVRNREPLIARLEALFLQGNKDDFLQKLEEFGVPCAPINDISNVFEDPQVQHRNLKIEVDHPAAGKIPMIANPIRFSEAELTYKAPPMLAEHTDDVLGELLNLDADALEKLAAAGIIQRREKP